MPIHDWTRVTANLFHNFHQDWSMQVVRQLNAGLLPDGYAALAEQRTRDTEPDVMTLRQFGHTASSGGVAVATKPAPAKLTIQAERQRYAELANRITIRHKDGEIVSIIEIVSPGNKDGTLALNRLVEKFARFIQAGIQIAFIDLFPPTRRDPNGLHPLIWEQFHDCDYRQPMDQPLCCASYSIGSKDTAHITPVAVGEVLPVLPVFLNESSYVLCPIEDSYRNCWDAFPSLYKKPLLTTSASPSSTNGNGP